MSQPPRYSIRKANPGMFQSDQDVVEQFRVRTNELDTVLEVLRGNVDAPSCQHVVVVAPRGRGKSMLLARVAAELRINDDLGRLLLPVRFMEESHEVFDLADFWLECLYFLAREPTVRERGLSDELSATHAALAAHPRGDRLIESRARAAVLDTSDRIGKKLVLMVENLQNLCRDVDEDFGWQLREALQSHPEIMLLASATSRFAALDDATQPFFDLFRIIGLGPLGADECERQANWHMTEGGSPLERRSNRTTFLREPCDGTREGAGEASVAVRAGRAMERRKRTTSGVPRPCTRSKATPVGPEKVRIDRTPRRRRTHARTYVIYRDLGGLRVVPAGCRRGRGGKA